MTHTPEYIAALERVWSIANELLNLEPWVREQMSAGKANGVLGKMDELRQAIASTPSPSPAPARDEGLSVVSKFDPSADRMLFLEGKSGSFRCDCRCNMFRQFADDRYRCNSCGATYTVSALAPALPGEEKP